VLMDEIKAAQSKLPANKRRSMSVYVPADAENDAPSKADPRVEDGALPAQPNDVKLAATPGGDVTITFADSKSPDIVGYRLYRSVNQVDYVKFGESIHLGDEYKFSFKADANVAASYYVAAVDVIGQESPLGSLVSYGTPSIPGLPEFPVQPGEGNGEGNGGGNDSGNPEGDGSGEVSATPSAPTGLQAESTVVSVLLSWSSNSVSDQVTQYHVYYSANSDGNYVKIATTSQTSYEHPGPIAKGSYQVTAENSIGVSLPSSVVTVE
jgi:penicillin-binding protein 1B